MLRIYTIFANFVLLGCFLFMVGFADTSFGVKDIIFVIFIASAPLCAILYACIAKPNRVQGRFSQWIAKRKQQNQADESK